MIAAIHLDDELDARRAEISNEASTDRHLPAKANADLARVERGPEASLRLGEARAVLPSEDHLSWSPVCGVARRSCEWLDLALDVSQNGRRAGSHNVRVLFRHYRRLWARGRQRDKRLRREER